MIPVRSRPLGALELLGAALLAMLLAGLVDRFTGVMAPRWDPVVYLDMARNGVWGNDHLVAPFAYRPAMPGLSRLVSDLFSLPLEQGFLWVCRFSAAAFLFTAYLLARRFTDSAPRAAVPVLFAATFVMPVKYSLFVPTSVDVAAFPVMVLAVWAYVGGRLRLCFAISVLGLFFKEFLAIPLFLCLAEYARAWRRDRDARSLRALIGSCAVAAAVILVPRLGLRVVETHQEIDPLHNVHSLSRLVMNPLSPGRDLNIVYDVAGFWLPCLLLWTRARGRELAERLVPLRFFAIGFAALNLLLAMYGGTNVDVFIAYSAPLQILTLAMLASPRHAARGAKIRPLEWALALGCVVLYNRTFFALPVPEDGFAAYIDFYAGWGSRVNGATLRRFLEMGGYAALMIAARRLIYPRATPAS